MRIKVISLNIWWGGELMAAAVDFLKSENADVVLLQEVHDGHGHHLAEKRRTVDVLRERLNYPYESFARVTDFITADGNLPSGNAILSRLPIGDSYRHYLIEPDQEAYDDDDPSTWPRLPIVLQHVRLDGDTATLNVFNFHGVWDMDGDNFSTKRKIVSEKILDKTKELKNVILAGDTNAKSTNRAMKMLEPQLKSVFNDELKTTFNMRRKDDPGYASAAVDLMFVSPEIKIISKDCPKVDISDHLPLVAELEVG